MLIEYTILTNSYNSIMEQFYELTKDAREALPITEDLSVLCSRAYGKSVNILYMPTSKNKLFISKSILSKPNIFVSTKALTDLSSGYPDEEFIPKVDMVTNKRVFQIFKTLNNYLFNQPH